MQNWNYQEYESIEYRGQNQQIMLYQLAQQRIQFPIQIIKNNILLCFNRNQAIRLSQLIELNHKSIVQVSPKMILKIIELCASQLLYLNDKQLLSTLINKENIWFDFSQEQIIITRLFYESDQINTDGQIRSFILEIWKDLFFEQKWYINQSPINVAYTQLQRGFNLYQINFQFEMLLEFDIFNEEINFKIDRRTSRKFCNFIRLIQEFQFEFQHQLNQSPTQYRALILNELIREHSQFVRNFRFKRFITTHQFQEILNDKLQLGATNIFLKARSADFIIEEQCFNLQNILDYCLRNSYFQPFKSIDQSERTHIVRSMEQSALVQVFNDLYEENKAEQQKDEALLRYLDQFESNLRNKILQNISNLPITQTMKENLIDNTLRQDEVKRLQKQFLIYIKRKSQTDLINFEIIFNQYMDDHNEQFKTAIQKSKQYVLDTLVSSLIQNQ